MAKTVNGCDVVCCLLLAAVCGGVAATTLGDWAVLTPDSFGYLSVARSLVETCALPEQRLTLPPGFSILIAPMMYCDVAPLAWIRMLLIAGWIIGSVFTFAYYRIELGRWWAFLVGLIVATSPAFLTQSACLLSELVFVPLVMASLIVQRTWRTGDRLGAGRVVFGGLLVAAAMMVRTMGVALVPVALATIATRRKSGVLRRILLAMLFLVGPVLLQAAWTRRNAQFPGGYGYRQILTQPRPGDPADAGPIMLQLDRLARYGPQRLGTIKEAVLPNHLAWRLFQPPWGGPVDWLIGGGLLLISVVRLVTRRREADAFVLVLFAILAVWPWNEGPRFVLPMLPIFAGSCVALLAGTRRRLRDGLNSEPTVHEAGRSRPRAVFAFALIGVVLCMQLVEDGLIARASVLRRARESERVARMRLLAEMLTDAVPESSPIACVMPNESYGKTLAIGAAYFADRRIAQFQDVRAGDDVSWSSFSAHHILTVDELAKSAGCDRVLLPAIDQDGRHLLIVAPN